MVTIITILILLNRLAEAGIDLGGLNPFLCHRRRKWQKKLQGNPIYQINRPLDVTALLGVATAKSDGDMSSEEKRTLLNIYQREFSMSKKDAAELLLASSYLFGNGEDLRNDLGKVMNPSLSSFTEDQAISAIKLLNDVCAVDAKGGDIKREFVDQVKKVFDKQFKPQGKWE